MCRPCSNFEFIFWKEISRKTEDAAPVEGTPTAHVDAEVLMSPAVRLLLEKYHLNPRLIQATGPKGRLLKGDVLRYVAQGGQPFTKPDKEATPTQKMPPKPTPTPETPVTGTGISVRTPETQQLLLNFSLQLYTLSSLTLLPLRVTSI